MPIPFILAGVAVAGTTLFGVASNAVNNQAKNELIDINNKIESLAQKTERDYKSAVSRYENTISTLIRTKSKSQNETLTVFADVYKNIKGIELNKIELEMKALMKDTNLHISAVNNSSNYKYKENTDQLVLGTVMSVTFGGAYILSNYIKYNKIQEKIEDAKVNLKKVETQAKAFETKITEINYKAEKAILVTRVLRDVDKRFRAAIMQLAGNIKDYGNDYSKYPLEVKKQLAMTEKFAIVTKLIIESSGLNDDGSIDEKVNEAVRVADNLLANFNKM
ncbi:hypothetical protein [Haloimpatiens massiliensis]|uniref:hypothetical protein n=1 Tax=Haloimpatiens massiliensis TaxID=1658110 RepID=UPI000C84AADA|nr:hypothetical protein [Haloimpatiens massiliensis]